VSGQLERVTWLVTFEDGATMAILSSSMTGAQLTAMNLRLLAGAGFALVDSARPFDELPRRAAPPTTTTLGGVQ